MSLWGGVGDVARRSTSPGARGATAGPTLREATEAADGPHPQARIDGPAVSARGRPDGVAAHGNLSPDRRPAAQQSRATQQDATRRDPAPAPTRAPGAGRLVATTIAAMATWSTRWITMPMLAGSRSHHEFTVSATSPSVTNSGTGARVPSILSSTYFIRTEREMTATVTPKRQTMVAPIGQSLA
jgi:hypothetical protein